jgi:23S rRNA pseudouridine1911/1915/1917 synthase
MAKPDHIALTNGLKIQILYEDRSVLAIDKPAGWLLAPAAWDRTSRNLLRALQSSLAAGDYWARARNLKFLQFIHRLDADTTGVLLMAKQPGAVALYSRLFASHQVAKTYLAVVHGVPKQSEWDCRLKLGPNPSVTGRMIVDARTGKNAETGFRVLQRSAKTALVEAHPTTGRTHQIRVHLAATGFPVLNDPLYGPRLESKPEDAPPLALRATEVAYRDPFRHSQVRITAPTADFLRSYGFVI